MFTPGWFATTEIRVGSLDFSHSPEFGSDNGGFLIKNDEDDDDKNYDDDNDADHDDNDDVWLIGWGLKAKS